jgi:prevent-host-death family protein
MTIRRYNNKRDDHRELRMKTATVAETKTHLSSLLTDIESGEEVVITRRGRPVARLVAEQPAAGFDWPELRAWVAGDAAPALTVAEMREQDLL